MVIQDTGIKDMEISLADLDDVMGSIGFVRWAWDYNHATYDFKIVDKSGTYFLRITADAVEGALEDPEAVLKLDEPFIGKHLFPHGLDYEADMPAAVVDTAKRKVQMLKEKLESF